jgi:chromosome segregation ATPase
MNKIYILVPLISVLVFGGFYLNFTKTYEARIAEAKAKVEEERKLKAKRDIAAREQAIKAAIEAQEKRKKEREEKERIEEGKKKARLDAEDRRQRTFDERKRFRDQVDRLKKEIEVVKADIAKLEQERKNHLDEQAFLRDYVKKAETNVKSYYDLIDKIAAADAAAAKAAADAAAAARKG